jgi:hypothetical protein
MEGDDRDLFQCTISNRQEKLKVLYNLVAQRREASTGIRNRSDNHFTATFGYRSSVPTLWV